jgi:predicted RNA-binding Zn ribbon-like protein
MATETLGSIEDLLGWLGSAAKLPGASIAAAADRLRRRPNEAAALFEGAIRLREAIYRIFSAAAAPEPVTEKDLVLLNRVLAEASRRDRLARTDDGYVWDTPKLDVSLPALLAPVLWSAADLLTHAERRRVRRCANDACLWLFIDESKAGTRRWCDMSSCGNRAKSRRHYLKTKAG